MFLFNDGKPPRFGCVEQIQMEKFGSKALSPVADWVTLAPDFEELDV
jgi:hypothetical protein